MRIRAPADLLGPRPTGAVLLVIAALVSGCATRVETDFDAAFDFTQVTTWAWAPAEEPRPGTDPRIDNDLLHQRVREAVGGALAARGLRETEANADLLVTYHLGIERKLDIHTYTSGLYGRYRGLGAQDVYVREYDVGTLLIDLVDPRSEQLVWRGSTQSTVHEGGTPAERDARARRAAHAVLEHFPPSR